MAFFNGWPFTQFQEQNLDWLINTVKQLASEYSALQNDFDSFKSYVENYFNSPEFSDEVKAAVEDLIDSGRLSDIFTINRLTNSIGNALTGQVEILQSDSTYGLQSIAADSNIIYVGMNAANNAGKLQKYINGVFSQEISGTYFHMNSMVIDPDNNLLYTADCIDNVSNTLIDTISVFDLSTFSFLRRFSSGIGSSGLTGLGFFNGQLYAISNNNNVYAVTEGQAPVIYCTLDAHAFGGSQAGYMDADYIYAVRSYPNNIIVFDHTGKTKTMINIGNVIRDSYPVGELEACYLNDGMFYIGSIIAATFADSINIVQKIAYENSNLWIPAASRAPYALSVLYVDGGVNTPYRINNDLTFTNIQQAIQKIKALDPGKFEIIVSAASSEGLVIESNTGYDIRINMTGYQFSGNVYLYDGDLSFYADFVNNSATPTFKADSYRDGKCAIRIYGSFTGTGKLIEYLNGSGFIKVNVTGSSGDTNVINGMPVIHWNSDLPVEFGNNVVNAGSWTNSATKLSRYTMKRSNLTGDNINITGTGSLTAAQCGIDEFKDGMKLSISIEYLGQFDVLLAPYLPYEMICISTKGTPHMMAVAISYASDHLDFTLYELTGSMNSITKTVSTTAYKIHDIEFIG